MDIDTLKSYKFSVGSTITEAPDILNGGTINEFLNKKYIRGSIFGIDNLLSMGVYRVAGWQFDFKPYLKRFLVKQHGQWHEYYAPNKTKLRKVIYGIISEIVELSGRSN